MVEDYWIHHRIGQAKQVRSSDAAGRSERKKYIYVETYQTDAGIFTPEEWRQQIRREIQREEKEGLLDRIKNHCREHCAWLRSEPEIEDYAMDCLAGGSYESWDDFQDAQEIIWM